MNPILQDQFIIDGKVYGIAQQGYVTGTVVNKKMLEDKGVAVPSYDWTWDDMLNTAKGGSRSEERHLRYRADGQRQRSRLELDELPVRSGRRDPIGGRRQSNGGVQFRSRS